MKMTEKGYIVRLKRGGNLKTPATPKEGERMKLEWIRKVTVMLIGAVGFETLYTNSFKEKKATNGPSKNPHSEEFAPPYPRELNFEFQVAERSFASFPFKKRISWPFHWVNRTVFVQPHSRRIIL